MVLWCDTSCYRIECIPACTTCRATSMLLGASGPKPSFLHSCDDPTSTLSSNRCVRHTGACSRVLYVPRPVDMYLHQLASVYLTA